MKFKAGQRVIVEDGRGRFKAVVTDRADSTGLYTVRWLPRHKSPHAVVGEEWFYFEHEIT